ncbi:MAG: hypothetical protein ACOC00_00165 [Halothiobacillaceae bacterium]
MKYRCIAKCYHNKRLFQKDAVYDIDPKAKAWNCQTGRLQLEKRFQVMRERVAVEEVPPHGDQGDQGKDGSDGEGQEGQEGGQSEGKSPAELHPELADLVDNRSIEPLVERGVTNREQLVRALQGNGPTLTEIPYMTVNAVQSLKRKLKLQ